MFQTRDNFFAVRRQFRCKNMTVRARFPTFAMHNTAVRMLGADGNPQQYKIEFKLNRGDLIVFPSWLRHGVRPYTGKRERISIAMNIDARRNR